MHKRHLLFVTGISVAAAVALGGCQGPQLNFGSSTKQPDSASQLEKTLQIPQNPNPEAAKALAETHKEKMKELKDFDEIKATEATIKTTKGDITFTLYRDKAPLTTANFLDLAKKKFYDGIVFHRVIPNFMAQVGDPLTKDTSKEAMWGTGGPDYRIADEFGEGLKHDSEGIVSMANAGPNSGGSQFFITYVPTPWLDGKHAIFGKVTSGMDVLNQIEVGDKIISITYQ